MISILSISYRYFITVEKWQCCCSG